VSVIDGAAGTVTATVAVGSLPDAVGVDPDTHAAYVTNENHDTVSVITPQRAFGITQTITQNGHSTVTTPAFSTTGPRLLVAFTSSDGGPARQATTVTGAGLTWTLVKRASTQPGTAEIWDARAAGPLTGATVTSTPKTAGYDQSLTVVAFTGASGIGATAASAGQAGGLPGVSLDTTRPGSWVYGVGQDYTDAVSRTPGTGQSLVSQWVDPAYGETFWVQADTAPTPAAGTPVTINDTAPKGSTWDLAAAEILPAGT
jgi:DNA-binding beta-propeller fold protein YncE